MQLSYWPSLQTLGDSLCLFPSFSCSSSISLCALWDHHCISTRTGNTTALEGPSSSSSTLNWQILCSWLKKGLMTMPALTCSQCSQTWRADLLRALWYSRLMSRDSKKERITAFQIVSFIYWSVRGSTETVRKGKWTLGIHLSVWVQVKEAEKG